MFFLFIFVFKNTACYIKIFMNKLVSDKKGSRIVGLLIFTAIIILNALGPYLGIQKGATFVLLPLLAIIALLNDISTFSSGSKEIIIFFLLFVWSLLSVYYYVDYDALFLGFAALLGAVIGAYISIGINKNNNYEFYFHIGYIVSIIILVIIMYTRGNIGIGDFAVVNDRSRFLLNANFYSYISYFANFSLFYLYAKRKTVYTFVLLLVLPVVFIMVAFATQSRSAILFIVLSNVCFWFFINKNESKNQIIKLLRIGVLLIILIFASLKFMDTFENSQIKNRVENTENSRQILAMKGIKYFMEHPFFGAGLAQFPKATGSGKFTHNSYAEVLAEHGVVGGLLLLLIFGFPTIQSLKNFKNHPQNVFVRLNLLFFITFLIYNNFYVFYKFSFAMIYFFLIVNIQNKLNIELNEAKAISIN